MKIRKRFRLLLLILICGICTGTYANKNEDSLKVYKIWDLARHNAFPDLIRHNNFFYCTFREGDSHVDNLNNGKVRVVRSKNAKNWETVALFEMDGVDVREARLSVTPSGQLMAILAAGVWKDNAYLSLEPYVSFSDKSGKNFGKLTNVIVDPSISRDLDWIWRVSWHKDTGYGVLYKVKQGERSGKWTAHLLKTKDGIRYENVSQFEVGGNPNESSIRFDRNGKMYVMIRRESEDRMGILGHSDYPYTSWNYDKLAWSLGGPNFLFLNDHQLVMGSRYHENSKAYTALFVTDLSGVAEKKILLPSGGDTSYPGMVIFDDKLWVAYYSSHEGKSNIYMAELDLKQLKSR